MRLGDPNWWFGDNSWWNALNIKAIGPVKFGKTTDYSGIIFLGVAGLVLIKLMK